VARHSFVFLFISNLSQCGANFHGCFRFTSRASRIIPVDFAFRVARLAAHARHDRAELIVLQVGGSLYLLPLALITSIIDREISSREISRYLPFVHENARGIAR